MTPQIAALLLAYLIGSVSFAVVVSRLMGLADPRTYGSGNPGATNVLRTGNRKAALLTLLGDALKGVAAVLLVRGLAPGWGLTETTVMLAGLLAFIGHLYPVFHRFQGGKGVATAAGVLLAVDPLIGLGTLATWLIIAFFSASRRWRQWSRQSLPRSGRPCSTVRMSARQRWRSWVPC